MHHSSQPEVVDNLHSLLDLVPRLITEIGTELWWRGQARSDWSLVPGVHRGNRSPKFEQNVTMRFWRAAPMRHPHSPSREDLSSWIQLMQHYRLPTRLLDWTQSPLIALYFAVSELPDQDGTLWALSPFALNGIVAGESIVLSTADPRIAALIAPAFKAATKAPAHTLATFGEEVDLRMTLQLSGFTIHGHRAPLEAHERHATFLRPILVPATAKAGLAKALWVLGVRQSNLFPDLENLAKELSTLEF